MTLSPQATPQFVRGPWEAEAQMLSEGEVCCVYDGDGRRIADYLTEDQANLIAAAPDLFAALSLMIADFADYPASERPCLAFDRAHAALAKARGETA